MDPHGLLEQFLGPNAGKSAGGALQNAKGKLASRGMGGMAGGLAAGGVLGLLLGNKKARKSVGKLAGGVVGYGGAAAPWRLGVPRLPELAGRPSRRLSRQRQAR